MHTGLCSISSILLILTISSRIVQANGMKVMQWDAPPTLSIPKEMLSNSLLVVHLQSILMAMASERDFSLNISAGSAPSSIQHPQSYRMTLLQVSSETHKLFLNTYSTMYRLQVSMKRIPDHIKTILRLIKSGSSAMISRMLSTTFNHITRIANENEVSIQKNVEQLTNIILLLTEIQQSPMDLSIKLNDSPSSTTNLILYNGVDAKSVLQKICITLQQMKKQFEQIAQMILDLDIQTNWNLSGNSDIIGLLPILYTLENNAYFLYQVSSISTKFFDRHVLDPVAGIGRYIILSTEKERVEIRSKLSEQLFNTLRELEQLFIERQNEFDNDRLVLLQVYEKLLDEAKH